HAAQNTESDPTANASFIQGMKDAAAGNGAAFNNALQDSSFVQRIDPRLAPPYLDGFSHAMSTVFLVATFILLIAFFVSFLLPHVELRSNSAYSQRAAEGAEPAAGAPADAPLVSVAAGDSGAADTGGPAEANVEKKRGRHRAQPGEKLH